MSKRKNTVMSDTDTTVTETKKRKSFVRGPQKVFAMTKITLADGTQLDPKNMQGITVEVSLSKDKDGVIAALMNGDKLLVQELEVPKAAAADDTNETEDAE